MMARARPGPNAADRMAVLGDPVRRAIFEMLAEGPRAVGDIAGKLPVTRSAVSQHLRALSDVGLVTHESIGTRNLYRIEPERVAEVRDYLDKLWEKALLGLKSRAEKPHH
jgi:DNA-binding transcriptional ArsR family regulator